MGRPDIFRVSVPKVSSLGHLGQTPPTIIGPFNSLTHRALAAGAHHAAVAGQITLS